MVISQSAASKTADLPAFLLEGRLPVNIKMDFPIINNHYLSSKTIK